MNVQIHIKPELKVSSRLQILYYVIYEIAEGLGTDNKALETIRKGVLERQLLGTIWINYLNENERLVGKVTITIDWDKHRVLAKDDRGREFELDPSQSVSNQISNLYSILVEHTQKLRKNSGVKRVVAQYGYAREIWMDEKKLAEARRFLDLVPGKEFDWEYIDGTNPDITFEIVANKLEELKISVEHHKRKKED